MVELVFVLLMLLERELFEEDKIIWVLLPLILYAVVPEHDLVELREQHLGCSKVTVVVLPTFWKKSIYYNIKPWKNMFKNMSVYLCQKQKM